MPSIGTTSLLNIVSNQKINHSGGIFKGMGHKFNEKFYNFEEIVICDYKEITMAGPMGQTVLSGGFSFFGFSLKSEKIGKV